MYPFGGKERRLAQHLLLPKRERKGNGHPAIGKDMDVGMGPLYHISVIAVKSGTSSMGMRGGGFLPSVSRCHFLLSLHCSETPSGTKGEIGWALRAGVLTGQDVNTGGDWCPGASSMQRPSFTLL
jgi:hypothetical protein